MANLINQLNTNIMATRKHLETLFERFCEIKNFKTCSERGDETFYENEFYCLNYAKYYGGYQIQKILKNSGCTALTQRMSAKEMYAYLRGLIDSVDF